MFDDPPIACHHDFSKCDLPLDSIPDNVSMVKPHLKTAWGDWSLVEATLNGLELLFNRADAPEWFIFLSGTDYPITPADKIIADFKSSSNDVYMSFLKLVKSDLDSDLARSRFKKYHTLLFKYPSFPHLLQSIRQFTWWKKDIYLKKSIYTQWIIPFTDHFNCYFGSQWISANRKAVESVLKFNQSNARVRFYYKRVHAPDESFFHTILGNNNTLSICNNNRRYIEWGADLKHPKELSMADLPNLLESDDHFARKFNIDRHPEILDRLDEHIGFTTKEK